MKMKQARSHDLPASPFHRRPAPLSARFLDASPEYLRCWSERLHALAEALEARDAAAAETARLRAALVLMFNELGDE